MKFSKLLFGIAISLIVLLPAGVVKALSIGGINVGIVASGDGLYSDSYESDRYVYKGSNPNNYIKLGGEMWRIVAIESDGTIKLVKDSFISKRSFDSAGARTTGYCSQGNAPAEGCNAWAVSDNFSNGSHTGAVSADSQLNTYLNGEYYNSLNSTVRKYIVDYDWGIGAVAANNTDLKGEISSENSVKWNGNVALISHSDYIRANSNQEGCGNDKINYDNYKTCRTTNWLYASNHYYWVLSPYSYYSENLWVICAAGTLSSYSAGSSYDVRPSIHITPDIDLTGNGTEDDPYTVDTPSEQPTPETTVEDDPAEVVNVPSTSKSEPFVILLTGFAFIVIAIIAILGITKVRKAKQQ